jgi:outer membrane receptor protein involved in Fe transport
LYTPIDTSGIKHSGLSFGYFAAATYKFNPDAEMFLRYSSASSPEFVRFGNDGQPVTVPSERITSYEGGYKGIWKSRLWVGLAGYYNQYSNFRSAAVGGEEGFTGKAKIYGAEADLKFRIVKQAELFANYSWTRTKIGSLAADGTVQANGGNQLPFSPEHRLSLGLNLSAQVSEGFEVFATPMYLFQTSSYFDEANSADLYQKSYGLLNCRAGFRLPNAGLTFLVYANNILNENYLVSGVSRTLNQASLTTVVPSPPRMVGARLSWDFKIKEKPYYKRKRR